MLKQPRISTALDAKQYNVLGVPHLVRISGADSGGTILFVELLIAAGHGLPVHVHTREDETFHVLKGDLEFRIGERTITATPGTTLFAPRTVPHGFRATAASDAALLIAITPAGLERMFDTFDRLPTTPPEMGRVVEILEQFGISIIAD